MTTAASGVPEPLPHTMLGMQETGVEAHDDMVSPPFSLGLEGVQGGARESGMIVVCSKAPLTA